MNSHQPTPEQPEQVHQPRPIIYSENGVTIESDARYLRHGDRVPSPLENGKRAEFWLERLIGTPPHPLLWIPRVAAWAAVPKLAVYAYAALEPLMVALGWEWYFAGAVSLLLLLLLGLVLVTRHTHPRLQTALDFHILIALGAVFSSIPIL